MSDAENVVEEHKKMMVMTGKLSDFQLENLQKWPFVVFNESLNNVSVDYDFYKEEKELYAGKVVYDFNFKSEPEKYEEELQMLTFWVKYLFWEDTKVEFKSGGKKWPTN